MDVENVEAVEEVLAQVAAAHRLLGHFVGGGHQPHVHFEFGLAAQAAHFGILQDAQQFGLRRHRHLADFVQQQGAVLGHFEAAGAALGGAGEGALFVAEQFAFDQRFGQRGAVDGDERPLPARAERVQRARHHFLAGAALAGDQHAGLARSGLLQQGENFLHLGRRAHHFAQRALVAELPFQHALFRAQAGVRAGAPDQHFQGGRGWIGFSRNQ